jgi:hypothetical protein
VVHECGVCAVRPRSGSSQVCPSLIDAGRASNDDQIATHYTGPTARVRNVDAIGSTLAMGLGREPSISPRPDVPSDSLLPGGDPECRMWLLSGLPWTVFGGT